MADRVYLDYAATAPLSADAAAAMRPFLEDGCACLGLHANPNSLHSDGREAFRVVEDARERIARVLKVRPHEMVFTGSATESDLCALFGIVAGAKKTSGDLLPHLVTTTVEHDAVFQAAHTLEKLGLARVTYVDPLPCGHIDPLSVERAIEPESTVLVSVIAVHNETGAVNDLRAIGDVAHANRAFFHTDAVQVLGKAPFDLAQLPVDAASFSAHKIGGPKGVGALYLKGQTPFEPMMPGGAQESGMRGGTQNISGIAGFAAALEGACGDEASLRLEHSRLIALRDRLYRGLTSFAGVVASVPCEPESREYAPHVVNVCVEGAESESLILQFDLAGFDVSGGSACSSRSLEPSRSLLALGIPYDRALGSLRVSIGVETTENQIEGFLEEFGRIHAMFER